MITVDLGGVLCKMGRDWTGWDGIGWDWMGWDVVRGITAHSVVMLTQW
jgi:hypothetical protein